jgi:hypothetical protein
MGKPSLARWRPRLLLLVLVLLLLRMTALQVMRGPQLSAVGKAARAWLFLPLLLLPVLLLLILML